MLRNFLSEMGYLDSSKTMKMVVEKEERKEREKVEEAAGTDFAR